MRSQAGSLHSCGRLDCLKCSKRRQNAQAVRQLLPPENKDRVKNRTVALNGRDRQGLALPHINKEVSYLGNRGPARIDTPATTPMAEV